MASKAFDKKFEPKITESDEFLGELYKQIEIGWSLERDATIVDRLAGEHPKYSLELYDFFTILIESELEQTDPEEVRATAEKTREWLDKEGFELVKKIAGEENNNSTNNTPNDSSGSESKFKKGLRLIKGENNEPDLAFAAEKDNLETISEFLQRRTPNSYKRSREKIAQDGAKHGITREEAYRSEQLLAARRRTNRKEMKLSDLIKKLSMNEEYKKDWLKIAKEDESE